MPSFRFGPVIPRRGYRRCLVVGCSAPLLIVLSLARTELATVYAVFFLPLPPPPEAPAEPPKKLSDEVIEHSWRSLWDGR